MIGPSGLRSLPKRFSSPPEQAGEASKRVSRYEGILQGIGGGAALGWAINRTDPATRVAVALVVDGELVAEGVADVPRSDLAGRSLDDGAHGFLIPLPNHLQAPGRRSIHVLVGPERTPLPAAPSFWQKPAADGTWSETTFEPAGNSTGLVPAPPQSVSEAAVSGSDGWLYADEEQERPHLTKAELEQAVALLVDNAQRCEKLGIAYIPALIPYKREVLSSGQGEAQRATHTIGSQLQARLRDVDGVELLDLLAVLHDASNHGAPYHRTDADWNDRGAFFVARALLKEAHKHVPALRPPTLADLHLLQIPAYRGALADLPKQGRARKPATGEPAIETEPGVTIEASKLRAMRMPVERHLAETGGVHLRVFAAPAQAERARLAVCGDAAALALVPWLAERASRTVFFWTDSLPLHQLELELPPVTLHLLRRADLLGATRPRDPVARCA